MLGRSVGNFCAGLAVTNLETGRSCGLGEAVRRNLMFVLPRANVVAVLFEAVTIVRDPQGHRLGDRLARTQVVLGSGAGDMVQSLIRWFQPTESAFGRLGRPPPGGRHRLPGVTHGAGSRRVPAGISTPLLLVSFMLLGCEQATPSQGYQILQSYNHDSEAYTQGLLFHDGYVFESTGRYGTSSLRKVNVETGDVVYSVAIDST